MTKFRDLPSDQQIGGYPRPGQLSGIVEDTVLDSEGRCVILEFPAFVLLGVYSPANRDESRDEFRTSFFEALDVRIRNLVAEGKQVILTGDLNVIRSEMDSTNVLETLRKENMTLEEWLSLPTRRIFNQLIFEGNIVGDYDEGRESPVLWDLCRCFHPDRLGMNTCWDTKRNTRPANNGSRIDYILCSQGIKDWFTFANIQEGLMGSDHCPVFATIADTVSFKDNQVCLSDVMNPIGMFKNGKRMRDLVQKDILPLSAKLIPEFDRRQSIRDMFFKKGTSSGLTPGHQPSAPSSVTDDSTIQIADGGMESKLESVIQPSSADVITITPPKSKEPIDLQSSRQQKRSPDPADHTPRQLKRSKSGTDSAGPKQKIIQGQTTLKGFFKPMSSATSSAAVTGGQQAQSSTTDRPTTTSTSPTRDAVAGLYTAEIGTLAHEQSDRANDAVEVPKSPEKVFDPIENKESWSKLLGKRVVPRCEHNEPCISLVTKKPGVNRGTYYQNSAVSLQLSPGTFPSRAAILIECHLSVRSR